MIQVRFRIDLGHGTAVGPGKIALLEAVAATGSLSAAARQIGMSYRRAWLLLDSLNGSFAEPVTTATVGGRGGGGVTLTPFGQDLVDRYRRFESQAGKLAARQFREVATATRKAGRDGQAAGSRPVSGSLGGRRKAAAKPP
jgi:molybdate transport system regulatory protein